MVQVAELNNDSVFAICQSDVTGVMFEIGNGSFANLNTYSSGSSQDHYSTSTMDMNNGTDSLSILLQTDVHSFLFFLLLIFNKNTYIRRRITFVLCILT